MGSWTPALNLTVTGLFTYNFNPGANQCANPASVQLTVQPQVEPVFTHPTTLCQNDLFILPTTAQNGITGAWNPQVNSQQVGIITVIFTPDAGQCSNSLNQTITVNPLPSNGISQNGITLSAAATGVAYQWIDCNTNQPVVGATNQSFTTTEAVGTYAVVVSTNGCSDTSDCITINDLGYDELISQVSIFPNHGNGTFKLKTTLSPMKSITIFDLTGRKLDLWADDNQFSIITHASGMFFIHVELTNGLSSILPYLKE
jgi:hypothetical protein